MRSRLTSRLHASTHAQATAASPAPAAAPAPTQATTTTATVAPAKKTPSTNFLDEAFDDAEQDEIPTPKALLGLAYVVIRSSSDP
jgi:hypothetical protein